MLLLPHARRITRDRNRTRRGNSSFPFHFVFRIRHCIFSSRAHISSWSRTRDTTPIRGLNHGWNRTIVRCCLRSHRNCSREWKESCLWVTWANPISDSKVRWIAGQCCVLQTSLSTWVNIFWSSWVTSIFQNQLNDVAMCACTMLMPTMTGCTWCRVL